LIVLGGVSCWKYKKVSYISVLEGYDTFLSELRFNFQIVPIRDK
jgi:hypothetical protein